MRLHTNAYRCFLVIFTFILLFSMALSANAQEYTARTRESLVNSIIKQNDDYIREHYSELLEIADTTGEGTLAIAQNNEELINDNAIDNPFTTVIYTIQDEDLLPTSLNEVGLRAVTTIQEIMPRDTGGNKGAYGNDSTVSVMAYSTIYYDTKTIDSLLYYRLRTVSGYYTLLDSSMQVIGQHVKYAQSGLSTESGAWTNGPIEKTPTASSWSYNTGFTNYLFPTEYSVTGVNYTIKMKRSGGSSTWEYTLQNHL